MDLAEPFCCHAATMIRPEAVSFVPTHRRPNWVHRWRGECGNGDADGRSG